MPLTVKQLKASRIPKNLGLCDDDQRLLQWYNEFQEDALNHGQWWGTYVAGEFCTFGGLIAWPRVVARVDYITVCGQTLDAKNQFYRFMSPVSQPGPCDSCGCGGGHAGRSDCGACGSRVWEDAGNLPVFRQVHGAKLIKLYPRSATDVGKRVLIQGYDVNKEAVRKQYGGIWVDGEYVTIGNPFGISSTTFTSITGIQKDPTDKNVLAYTLDLATGHETLIADWQPDEVNPSYRLSRVPCLCGRDRHSDATTHRPGSLKAIVKLEHIPVSQDTDWLILGNMVAIEHGMRARMFYERNQDVAADKEMIRSINALNHELRTHAQETEVWIDIGTESFRDDLNCFQ